MVGQKHAGVLRRLVEITDSAGADVLEGGLLGGGVQGGLPVGLGVVLGYEQVYAGVGG